MRVLDIKEVQTVSGGMNYWPMVDFVAASSMACAFSLIITMEKMLNMNMGNKEQGLVTVTYTPSKFMLALGVTMGVAMGLGVSQGVRALVNYYYPPETCADS